MTRPDMALLTVRELRRLLEAIPEEQLDYLVLSAGCDCDGVSGYITIDPRTGTCVIERHQDYIGGGMP